MYVRLSDDVSLCKVENKGRGENVGASSARPQIHAIYNMRAHTVRPYKFAAYCKSQGRQKTAHTNVTWIEFSRIASESDIWWRVERRGRRSLQSIPVYY